MPKLARLYIRQPLVGFVAASGFVALLLAFNMANLWHLLSTSGIGVLAVFLLVTFHGIVFFGVQFGISVTRPAQDGAGSGGRRRAGALVPIRVETRGPRRG